MKTNESTVLNPVVNGNTTVLGGSTATGFQGVQPGMPAYYGVSAQIPFMNAYGQDTLRPAYPVNQALAGTVFPATFPQHLVQNTLSPWNQLQSVNPALYPQTLPFNTIPQTMIHAGIPTTVQNPVLYPQTLPFNTVPQAMYQNGITANVQAGVPTTQGVTTPWVVTDLMSTATPGYKEFTSWTPAINICESERAFLIEIEVSGVNKDDCKVGCEKGVLWVSGTRRSDTEGSNILRKEFKSGTFYRSFILPEYLETEKIVARCTNGLLTVSIPKKTANTRRSDGEITIS